MSFQTITKQKSIVLSRGSIPAIPIDDDSAFTQSGIDEPVSYIPKQYITKPLSVEYEINVLDGLSI